MASVKSSVKLEGFSELLEAMQDLSKSTQGNVLKRAVSRAGADFADAAAALAPKKTGALKEGIKVGKASVISPGKAAYAAAKQEGASNAEAAQAARQANREAGGTGRQVVVHVGPVRSLRAAVPQEFGTSLHSPKPYMRPAWDQKSSGMLETIRETLKVEVDKAAARAAKKAAKIASKS